MEKLSKVVVYGSLGLRPGISELLWAFRKTHTLEEFPVYLDDHPFHLMERIKQEQKHGMKTADVVMVPHYVTLRMKSEGMLGQIDLPESSAYPRKFVDPERAWWGIGVTFMTMAYNSRLVKAKDLPRGLEDLSSPKWKGRLGTQSLTASKVGNIGALYLAYLKRVVGKRKWERFVAALAGPNRPKAYDCIDHLLQGLLDGDNRIALGLYSLAYFRERLPGVPLAPLEIEDAPKMLTFTCASVLKESEADKSAVRFADFLLSPKAQAIIGTIRGIAPTRPGSKTGYPFEVDYADRADFHPDKSDLREIPGTLERFRKLGLP